MHWIPCRYVEHSFYSRPHHGKYYLCLVLLLGTCQMWILSSSVFFNFTMLQGRRRFCICTINETIPLLCGRTNYLLCQTVPMRKQSIAVQRQLECNAFARRPIIGTIFSVARQLSKDQKWFCLNSVRTAVEPTFICFFFSFFIFAYFSLNVRMYRVVMRVFRVDILCSASAFTYRLYSKRYSFRLPSRFVLGKFYCANGCGKSYTLLANMRKHLRFACMGVRQFQCQLCLKRFTYKHHLQHHQKSSTVCLGWS